MEFQVGLVENLLQDFAVEIIEVQDSNLTFEILYIGDNVIGPGFVDRELILIHSELLDHFHEGIDREGVVLHGHAEFFLGALFRNVLGFNQGVLLYHLTGVA